MKRMHTTSASGFSSNASAFAALDAEMERLRRLPDVPKLAAPNVAKSFDRNIHQNVAAQQDIYGHAFHPAQDGRNVLTHGADAVAIDVQGTKVVVRLEGIEAMHQVGSARGYRGGSARLGGFRRPLIPFGKIPGPWKGILREELQGACVAVMRGDR